MKVLSFTYGDVLLDLFSTGSFLPRNGVSAPGFVRKEREICLLIVDMRSCQHCHIRQTKPLMSSLEEQMFYLGTCPDLEKKIMRNSVVASFVSSSSLKSTEEILSK